MKPIILVLTDSVALPRQSGKTSVLWNQTYIHQFKEKFKNYQILNVSIGGATIKDLYNQLNYYEILQPAIVILQCGIVDATPRAFGRLDLEVLKKAHLFRFTKYMVPFLRKYRSHHYTEINEFKNCLDKMKTRFNTEKFYAIGIIPAVAGYEVMAPGITKSIKKYNDALRNAFEYISLEKIPSDGVLPDYHHINSVGHNFIYNKLLIALTSFAN